MTFLKQPFILQQFHDKIGWVFDFNLKRLYFRCPPRFMSNVTVEYRFGFSKHGADLEPEYINRCIVWMRVNTDMYAIGREKFS